MATRRADATHVEQCDLCGRPLAEGGTPVVEAEAVLQATAAGYVPQDNAELDAAARQAGLERDAFWLQVVEENSQDAWTVCSPCREVLVRWGAHADGHPHPTCWFCGRRKSGPASDIDQKLHREIERPMFTSLPGISSPGDPLWLSALSKFYEECSVCVPRCRQCSSVHGERRALLDWTWPAIKSLLFGSGVLVIAGALGADSGFTAAGIIAAFVFGVVPAALGIGLLSYHIYYRRRHRDAKPESASAEHPGVKEQVEAGWTLGAAPGQRLHTVSFGG
ncbi:hypothetical protein HQ576_20080 [bacterium]|nr:hypothetical protein [bacterium]